MIKLSGQNMTEGAPTSAILSADIFVGQEINKSLVRQKFKAQGMKTYVSRRDQHQCISWDPEAVKVTGKGWNPFHLSGEAEGWEIKSPARGLIFIKGETVRNKQKKIAVGGCWTINSWGKDNAEGPFRKRIMMERTLPVILKWIDQMHDEGRTVFLEGDTNNVRWAAQLKDMKLLTKPGTLEHMWVSEQGDFRLSKRGVWKGPKTGVGPDLKHYSLNAAFVAK